MNYLLEKKLNCYTLNSDVFFLQSIFKDREHALKTIYRILIYMKGSFTYKDVMQMKSNEFLDFLNTYTTIIKENNKK